MERTTLDAPGGWVLVRELGSVLGGMSDQMVNRFVAGAGVTVEKDWAGRRCIPASDAARLVADRTTEAKRNAEAVARFDRYLAIYREARTRAHRLAFARAHEALRQRELRALQTPGFGGFVNGLRIKTLSGNGRYTGSPQAYSHAQDRAKAADEAFAKANKPPLPFGPWREAGEPESPFGRKSAEKAIETAVQTALEEGNTPHV